jgi:hypothetical protein
MNLPLSQSEVIDPTKIRLIPIPDSSRHDVIYATLCGKDGRIYLGVSSEFHPQGFARLMAYDPHTDRVDLIVDLAALLSEAKDIQRPPHSKIHTTLCLGREGTIWFATHVTAPSQGERFHRIWEMFDDPIRGYTGSHIISYNPVTEQVIDHGIVLPREGCRFMTMDLDREELHLVSYPRAHFIVYRPKSGQIVDIGRISQVDSLGPTWSGNGFTYTTDDRGMMLRYDPAKERMEPLPIFLPDAPWRTPFGNRVRRMKAGPDGVKLYGFGWQSTRLFEYDPRVGEYGSMKDYGLVIGSESMTSQSVLHETRGLTFGKDGKIYCGFGPAQGERELRGLRILSVDPETHEVVNHGLLRGAHIPRITKCQDMATGEDGTIYLGTFGRERPLVLVLFHPEGKLPENRSNPEGRPLEIKPSVSAYGLSISDEGAWQAFRREEKLRKQVFVTEGSVIARELGWSGKYPAIPAGESQISALKLWQDRMIYGTTSGFRSHLFIFDPSPEREGPLNSVVDLGIIAESESGVNCQSLVIAAGDKVYMGTHFEGAQDGHIYAHDPESEILERFLQFMIPSKIYLDEQIEDLGVPIPGEGIFTLAACPRDVVQEQNVHLCGITTPSGFLFVYDVDERSILFKQQVTGSYLPRAFAVTPEGLMYGSGADGQLFRFNLANFEIHWMDLWLPASKGREYLNTIDSLVRNEDGTFYGGTRADGMLFHFDPYAEEIVSLGKPVRGGRIRALTTTRARTVFGMAGDDGYLSRLFRYDLSTGDLRDLGILRATLPDEWVGHEFDALLTGPHGEIYVGESDRISRLFTYFPPY